MTNWEPLVETALLMRERAYAPYSGYRVGSALLTADGVVHGGCNVENRTYGLTICAERVALVSAIATGIHEIDAVAVATASSPPAPPCGQCLDALAEFCSGDLPVLLVNDRGERSEVQLRDLLPRPFELPLH